MSDSIQTLRLFVRVARTGSFSRAGRELSLSQPSVSRLIAELERKLGARLLNRSTRALSLTESGADYLQRVEAILAALDEAEHAARGTGELRGVLRVGVSSSLAVREVIPRLPDFLARHPALRVELTMVDHHQNLLSEGVDVALRFGALPDSASVTARRLATQPRILVAAPAYLARAGTPKRPADLARHQVVAGPAGAGTEGWRFEKDGRQVSVRVAGRVGASLNEGAVAAAVAGLGIVTTVPFGCGAELRSGALVRVLEDWRMDSVELHAVFAAGRAAKPAARVFAAWLGDVLRD